MTKPIRLALLDHASVELAKQMDREITGDKMKREKWIEDATKEIMAFVREYTDGGGRIGYRLITAWP